MKWNWVVKVDPPGGVILTWMCCARPGSRSGMMVRKVKRPLASVAVRPKNWRF